MTKAIRLHRAGDYVHVDVEVMPGKFITIIREPWDNAFCHVIEPSMIDRLCEEAKAVPS